jgi:hypothetical protein
MIKSGMRKIQVIALATSSLLLIQIGTAVAATSKKSALTIPITLPVAQTGVITFANAESKFDAIPEAAWQRTQDVIASNKPVAIPTEIHIGPNTSASKSTIVSALDRINKLFAGFRHVSSYTGIVYNAKDQQWAQSDAAAFFKAKKIYSGDTSAQAIKSLIQAGCEFQGDNAVDCSGGMTWDFSDARNPAGGSYYGVQNAPADVSGGFWTEANKNSGPMTQVNHEATHNYQITQFFNTPLGKNQHMAAEAMHAFSPWWFSEAQANAIGIATFTDNLDAYKQTRLSNVTRSPGPNATLPVFTADGLKKFLVGKEVAGPENKNWPLAYTVGYAAAETLVAIGGPQSTLALYTLGAQGKSWDTAFKTVYGISWDEGASVLAKVLAAEYAAKPIALRS